jgi:hypothetical protein
VTPTLSLGGQLDIRWFTDAHAATDVIFNPTLVGSILRTFFERKGRIHEAMNWFNVVIASHSHLNLCRSYDNSP